MTPHYGAQDLTQSRLANDRQKTKGLSAGQARARFKVMLSFCLKPLRSHALSKPTTAITVAVRLSFLTFGHVCPGWVSIALGAICCFSLFASCVDVWMTSAAQFVLSRLKYPKRCFDNWNFKTEKSKTILDKRALLMLRGRTQWY